jgi:hypothetical protein
MAVEESLLSEARHLTVGYQLSERRPRGEACGELYQVPRLRLSGKWLHEAGFTVGRKVRLHVLGRGIVIVPED